MRASELAVEEEQTKAAAHCSGQTKPKPNPPKKKEKKRRGCGGREGAKCFPTDGQAKDTGVDDEEEEEEE